LRSRQKKRKRKATKELKNHEAAGTDGEGSPTEQLPRIDPVGEGAPREHRKVVRIAREMFTSSIEEDVTGNISRFAFVQKVIAIVTFKFIWNTYTICISLIARFVREKRVLFPLPQM